MINHIKELLNELGPETEIEGVDEEDGDENGWEELETDDESADQNGENENSMEQT